MVKMKYYTLVQKILEINFLTIKISKLNLPGQKSRISLILFLLFCKTAVVQLGAYNIR